MINHWICKYYILYFSLLFIIFANQVYGENQKQTQKDEIWVSGNVLWPGNELAHTSVEVFKDPQFKNLYTRALLLKPDGIYAISIEDPGTYYLVAFVDHNDNSTFDTGDAMGIYGVSDWANPNQKPKPLSLEKGAKLTGIDIPITAVVDSQGRVIPLSAFGSNFGSGISGKVIWPDNNTSGAIVFAYSDPTWNNRIAQTEAGENGRYEIQVPPGRYYVIAVMDENNTNLLDAGDKFGIWGMTRFGAFPKPIKVEEGQTLKDRNILITGKMGISGKALPLKPEAGEAEKSGDSANKTLISGSLTWPGHSFKSGLVQVYNDPSMTGVVAQAKTDNKGKFTISVPYGDYYIMASADTDGDGKYTAGDGIGAYGTSNAAEEMPKKLSINKNSKNLDIKLTITAEFDKSGQLKPIVNPDSKNINIKAPQTTNIQELETNTENITLSNDQGISGRIIWEGCEISKASLIFSTEPKFEEGIKVPLQLEEDGKYTCSAPVGDYYLMVIVDINSNDENDPGDGIGIYGSGYWSEPQKVTIIEGNITPYINININSVFGDDGHILPMQTPVTTKFQYGDPDKVTTDRTGGREIKEWWYWKKGMSFKFEKLDTGWNLIDTDEFPPMVDEATSEETDEIETNQDGTIYYTFDMNIWSINVDGRNRKWVAQGTYPAATSDGQKMLIMDTNGNIYLIEPKSELPGKIIVSRRKSGSEPAISNNGKAIVFIQVINGIKSIVLKNMENNEEDILPIGTSDLYCPSWSFDDNLIAYSVSAYDNQNKLNRDIYYYDLTTGKIKSVSTNPLDEFGPAWSPLDNHSLIYCRAEGGHSQIWIVNFHDQGKISERQLTRYGGQNPAWSPKGDRIIYENNSQLWTIKPDGSDEKPIIIGDEPIFGLDPFWTK